MESKGVNELGSSKVAENAEPIVSASEDVKWGTSQIPVQNAPDPLKNPVSAGK